MTEVTAIAPGKVILHGEHAVVYGTKAIAVSVGLNTLVTITKSSVVVKVKFEEVGIDVDLTIEELQTLKNLLGSKFRFAELNAEKVIPLEKNVCKVLGDFLNDLTLQGCPDELKTASKAAFEAFLFLYLALFSTLVPIEIKITTELPVGAGLGSSASFAVALAGGLLISSGKMMPTSIDKDLINRWAYTSECFVHGNPSGLDNSVATYGSAIIFKKGHPLMHIKCSEIRALLVNTEVPRSTKELVARVAKLKETDPIEHQATMDAVNSLIERVIVELNVSGQTTAEYVLKNQELLCKMNVSHPKIDSIVDIAKRNGFSAKLTGAGGGGCVFIYIPPDATSHSVVTLKDELTTEGFTKFWDIPLGGDGFKVC